MPSCLISLSDERTPVVVDALRTPFGKFQGILKSVRPDTLAAAVMNALLARNPGVLPETVDDVLIGCANQAGEDARNLARMAVLISNLPVTVPGATINRLCGSGLTAIQQAAQAIMSGEGELYLAGGVESMSRSPYVLSRDQLTGETVNREDVVDSIMGWRFTNPALLDRVQPYTMAETAALLAKRFGVSREAQDAYTLQSHQKSTAAREQGYFEREIVPLLVGDQAVLIDDGVRPTLTPETLARLKPLHLNLVENNCITQANASPWSDGAAMVLMMSLAKAKQLGFPTVLKWVGGQTVGLHPDEMGLGAIPATQKLLQRLGLSTKDLDRVELDESFSVQALLTMEQLDLNPDKTNSCGGALAIGHPLGAAGARNVVTLFHQFQQDPSLNLGLVNLCIGLGQGMSAIFKRTDTFQSG